MFDESGASCWWCALAGIAWCYIRHQSCCKRCRLAQGNEMTARYLVSSKAEAFTCHPTLELSGKEPIIAPHKHAGWYGGPCREGAWGSEHRIRLAWLTLRPGIVNNRLWHVVEEVDQRVKSSVRRTTVAHVLIALRVGLIGRAPPLARGLVRFRDHGIDEHEQCDVQLLAHEWRDEASQRLCHQDDALWIAIANRADDGVSVR